MSIKIHITKNDVTKTFFVEEGTNLMMLAKKNSLVDGTCGGSMICSTCHVIVPSKYMSFLPSITEAEENALDLAFDLTSSSRLGCQIFITKDLTEANFIIPT